MSSIVSPCISICKTDPVTGLCYGCARKNEEKKLWKDENTKDEWKLKNLKEIQDRLSGWQLDPIYMNNKRVSRKDLDKVSETRPIGI